MASQSLISRDTCKVLTDRSLICLWRFSKFREHVRRWAYKRTKTESLSTMRGQVSKHRDRPYQAGRSKQRRLRIVKDEADIGAYKTHGSSSACAGNFEEGFPTALPRGRSRATSSGAGVLY